MKKQNIYKDRNPKKDMKKEEKIIVQVKEDKNKQKRVTIPKSSKIQNKDYVEVKKLK